MARDPVHFLAASVRTLLRRVKRLEDDIVVLKSSDTSVSSNDVVVDKDEVCMASNDMSLSDARPFPQDNITNIVCVLRHT